MRKLLKCLIETLKLESKKDGKSTKQLKYTKDNLKIKESKKKMKYLYRDIKEIIEDTLNRVGLYNEQASTMVFNTGLV
jgi:iron-sulfur cluster repair protein YtfE (RIC family)